MGKTQQRQRKAAGRATKQKEQQQEAKAEEVQNGNAEEEEEVEEAPEMMIKPMQMERTTTEKKMTNRQKVLVLGSRNMSGRDRHLLTDLRGIMPHAREHPKVEARDDLGDRITELASLHRCNSVMFIEARKHETAFMWLGQAPSGPSVRFELLNVHTADALRMAGNCLKYSRPMIHFDKEFEVKPHLRVVKSLLQQTFNVPRYHPQSKPFVDHIISFHFLDDHVWFRHYQVIDDKTMRLMEIGPRFALLPLTILNGCLRGSVLWKHEGASSPTELRKARKQRKLARKEENDRVQERAQEHREKIPAAAPDPLDTLFK